MNYVVREVYEAFMAVSNLRRAPKGMCFIAVVTVVLLASLPTAAVKGQDRAQQPSAQASGESSGTDGGQIEAAAGRKSTADGGTAEGEFQLLDARRAADARRQEKGEVVEDEMVTVDIRADVTPGGAGTASGRWAAR